MAVAGVALLKVAAHAHMAVADGGHGLGQTHVVLVQLVFHQPPGIISKNCFHGDILTIRFKFNLSYSMPMGGHGSCHIRFKKSRKPAALGSIFPLGNDRNFDDYLAVVLLKFVMAGGLVTVAGEHHIEHARTDRNRCGIARIEVIVVFRVGCRGIAGRCSFCALPSPRYPSDGCRLRKPSRTGRLQAHSGRAPDRALPPEMRMPAPYRGGAGNNAPVLRCGQQSRGSTSFIESFPL